MDRSDRRAKGRQANRGSAFTVEFSGLSGQAFADFARKERETLAPIVEKANIKLN
jgi:fibrillarin-like rRNA methylase